MAGQLLALDGLMVGQCLIRWSTMHGLLYLQPTRMMELMVWQWLAVLAAYQNDGTYG